MAGEFFAKGGVVTPSLDIKASGNTPLIIRNPAGTEVLTYKTNNKTTEIYAGPPSVGISKISASRASGTTGYSHVSYLNGQLFLFERQVGSGTHVSISSDNAKTMNAPFKLFSGSGTIRTSIYYNNTYIFAGYDVIVYSADQLKGWDLAPKPAGTDIVEFRIAKNGTLVGFGKQGECYTTNDGKAWTKRTIPASTSGAWYQGSGVMPSGDLWYVCGDGKIYTSPDGITWAAAFNSKPNAKQHCQGSDGKIIVFVQESPGVVNVYSTNSSFSVYTQITAFSAQISSNTARSSGQYIAYTLELRGKTVLSMDGGKTWEMENTFPTVPVNSMALYASTIAYQFDDSTTFELQYREIGKQVSILTISDVELSTGLPQGTSPTSLVRKDYVDTEIAGKIQIQTDALVQKQEQTAAAVKELQDTTLDYGEY